MFLARRSLGIAYTPLTRRLSSRASSVLGALDIPTTPTELHGVYDGEWKGSGDILQSLCPTTGEVLAHVKTVRFSSSVSVSSANVLQPTGFTS
jgi:aldehyde dehydrogenase family 7 protein A1